MLFSLIHLSIFTLNVMINLQIIFKSFNHVIEHYFEEEEDLEDSF